MHLPMARHYLVSNLIRQTTVIAVTRIAPYLEDDMFVLVRYPEEGSRCNGYGCIPLK